MTVRTPGPPPASTPAEGRRAGARVLAAAVIAAIAVGGSCRGSPGEPTPAGSRDLVLLLGARAFDDGPRVAELLQDMLDVSDVLGPARVSIGSLEDGWPDTMAAAVDAVGRARAVVALVGDLSLLRNVDPSQSRDPARGRSRRDVDLRRLTRGLVALRAACTRAGAALVLATAPRGVAARVEVPELDAVLEIVRDEPGALDLAGHFTALERSPMFAHGLDVLEPAGHDELARVLWQALLVDPGPVPPRDASERGARAEARALQSYRDGELQLLGPRMAEALAFAPSGARSAARQAALVAACDGLEASAARWAAIDAPPELPVPGLALGLALTDRRVPLREIEDPLEAELAELLAALAVDARAARSLAEDLVDRHPERIEAWIGWQLTELLDPPAVDRRLQALDTLSDFPRTSVPRTTALHLLGMWPATVVHLPALAASARPFARLQPTGPLIDAIRRRELLGMHEAAAIVLARELPGRRHPPAWRAELERLQGR